MLYIRHIPRGYVIIRNTVFLAVCPAIKQKNYVISAVRRNSLLNKGYSHLLSKPGGPFPHQQEDDVTCRDGKKPNWRGYQGV